MQFSFTPLGISAAVPFGDRHLAAHVLQIHQHTFLIDCGEGTLFQLQKHKIKFHGINHIFISHLHGDHFFGLAGILTTIAMNGRRNALHIFSPNGLAEIIQTTFKFSGFRTPYPIHFHAVDTEISQQLIDETDFSVRSFPLQHRIPTMGFFFEEKPLPLNMRVETIAEFEIPFSEIKNIKSGSDYLDVRTNELIPNARLTFPPMPPRSFAYCSDTVYVPDNVKYFQNVSLLYHESTFLHEMAAHARESGHSTALEAAEIATLANAHQLIIGHFSARYTDLNVLKQEACVVFAKSELAEEGKTFSVSIERSVQN